MWQGGGDPECPAAELPPDLVAAAQKRGLAHDLEAMVKELLADLETGRQDEGSMN